MTKTVKDIIEDRISYFKSVYEGREDLIENEILILENILQAHENELAKKDRLASEEAILRITVYQELKKELAEKEKRYIEYKSNFENIMSDKNKKLAEKDKLIKNLENKWEELVCNNYELQQHQLYKEDFTEFYVCEQHGINLDNCNCSINKTTYNFRIRWLLKDNSKYDKLESKEDQHD